MSQYNPRPRSRMRSWAALGALALILCALAACSGWRQTAGNLALSVQAAGNLADRTLGAAATAADAECLRAYPSDLPGYRECIRAWREALAVWRGEVRPVLDRALVTVALAIQAGREGAPWLEALRDAACRLLAVVRTWRPMAAELGRVETAMMLAYGWSCSKEMI